MKFSSTAESRKDLMLTQPLPKLIMRMATPTIIAFLINSVYSLTDTYFVSSLGTNATAAVSVNSSLDQIIMMTGSMLAIGANSYIARLLGAKEEKEASCVLSTAFFLAAGFGLIVTLLGSVFMEPMVRLLGSTDTCRNYAMDYAVYVLMVAPFMAANFVMNQCLRAEGAAMLAMVGMGLGGILNCFLDPIFIFVLDMGVAGASLATAISKLVSFAILIYPYFSGKSFLHISLRLFRFSKSIITQIVFVGSSSLFRNGLAVIAAIILNRIAGGVSDSVLAGIGVSTKVMMFPFGIVLGFGSGFQPVAGFNWGAADYDRVRKSYRFAARAVLLGSAAMGAFLFAFAYPAIDLFAQADPQMQQIGALCIRSQCLALPIHGWVAVVNMFCAGIGDAKGALLLSTARQGSCFLPFVHLSAALLGAYGVATIQAVADLLTLLLAVPVLRSVMRRVNAQESLVAAQTAAFPANDLLHHSLQPDGKDASI